MTKISTLASFILVEIFLEPTELNVNSFEAYYEHIISVSHASPFVVLMSLKLADILIFTPPLQDIIQIPKASVKQSSSPGNQAKRAIKQISRLHSRAKGVYPLRKTAIHGKYQRPRIGFPSMISPSEIELADILFFTSPLQDIIRTSKKIAKRSSAHGKNQTKQVDKQSSRMQLCTKGDYPFHKTVLHGKYQRPRIDFPSTIPPSEIELTPRIIITVTMMLAKKFLEDGCPKNNVWARASGLDLPLLNRIEREVLSAL
ncbi:hypothetical protein HK096_001083, partial [Nowakowskiella sp. JEL0078]